MRIVYNKKVKDKEVIIREDDFFYVSIFNYSGYNREQNFLKKVDTLDEAKKIVNDYFGYII